MKTIFSQFLFIVVFNFGLKNEQIRTSGQTSRVPRYGWFRIMTLNAFHGGNFVNNGLQKISKHILINNPHIVALQEMNLQKIDELLKMLGGKWKHCNSTYFLLGRYLDTCILTRLPIEENYEPVNGFCNTGCRVTIENGQRKTSVNVWNVHLFNWIYGPYQVCFHGKLPDVCLKTEHKYRVKFIERLLNHPQFQNNLEDTIYTPLLLVGDFNSPSHLDWIHSTRKDHCNVTVSWPVTSKLAEYNFTDSYRHFYSDPLKFPGYTWSPIVKINDDQTDKLLPEPQDRIDYVFYKSEKLILASTKIYVGNESISYSPNQFSNDWPSDHAALVSVFIIP